MIDFEDQLRRALERKEPSADFTARVMARARQSRRPLAWMNWRGWAAAGLAASLLVGVFGIEMQQRQRTRERGEVARAQLMQAMRLTSVKLHQIHKKVQGEL